eukprot:gb/GEZN01001808.1/.p1 GENE.gb/GEZN01001808.1/~~gb/GEZN01001808.1/.p1  ORF type:complete len:718 (-),score=77.46 gb/GEZN01001808.1/:147-2300(-)
MRVKRQGGPKAFTFCSTFQKFVFFLFFSFLLFVGSTFFLVTRRADRPVHFSVPQDADNLEKNSKQNEAKISPEISDELQKNPPQKAENLLSQQQQQQEEKQAKDRVQEGGDETGGGTGATSVELQLQQAHAKIQQLQSQLFALKGFRPVQTASLTDMGYADRTRGWYDAQNQGICNDYCRWVGEPAYFSCALAGTTDQYSLAAVFQDGAGNTIKPCVGGKGHIREQKDSGAEQKLIAPEEKSIKTEEIGIAEDVWANGSFWDPPSGDVLDACNSRQGAHSLWRTEAFKKFRFKEPYELPTYKGGFINYSDPQWIHADKAHPHMSKIARPQLDLRVTPSAVSSFLAAVPLIHRSLPRIVLSLTTVPQRIKYLPAMLADLKSRSLHFDTIYLSLPEKLNRSGEVYEVPDWLLHDPDVTLLRPARDFGPATKVLPAVQAELKAGRPHTRIVVMDDDMMLRDQELLLLLTHSLLFPGAAVTREGWQVQCYPILPAQAGTGICKAWGNGGRYRLWVRSANASACEVHRFMYSFFICTKPVFFHSSSPADILTGFSGFVVQPSFFSRSLLYQGKEIDVFSIDVVKDKSVFYADDPWISGWLEYNQVPRLVVNWDGAGISDAVWSSWVGQILTKRKEMHNISHLQQSHYQKAIRADFAGVDGLHNTHKHKMELANIEVVNWFRGRGWWNTTLFPSCYACSATFDDDLCGPPRTDYAALPKSSRV